MKGGTQTPTPDPKIKCSYVKMVPITQLKPHPDNPNLHTPEQLSAFAEVLRFQGTRRPFRVSKRSGYMTAGHGQLEAYKINGWNMCPVDLQDYDDDKQEYADLVADNSLAAWATLDLDAVHKQVATLGKKFDPAMLGIDGFSVQPVELSYPEQRGNNELTKDEKTTEYLASQSRNIILVYSLPDFGRVTELLKEIMQHRSFETFSDAVKTILEEYARTKIKKGSV